MKCPICKKKVAPDSASVPFCSERCRETDLGRWATGEYRIPAMETEDEEADEPLEER